LGLTKKGKEFLEECWRFWDELDRVEFLRENAALNEEGIVGSLGLETGCGRARCQGSGCEVVEECKE
jgi:hypothetical protein